MPSLNESLQTGPKLKNNLSALLLKWRLYKIGFESLRRILYPKFEPSYIVAKERFHKNINGYDFVGM